MIKNKSYAGIDAFRIIAALLVITIHTSPLLTYSQETDFVLTRIIARVAVPFFITTSGFFLISRHTNGSGKLIKFIKKTALIYAAAIIFYIPINIYNGYFGKAQLPDIISDILINGTMYHLWYLPASIMGAAIAWLLVKKTGLKSAFIITAALYLIGLFGDSYYGAAEQIPLINEMYKQIFKVSEYTRNGLFFTPVFFVLGGLIANGRQRLSLKYSALGLSASFLLMLCEGLILNGLKLQRHDSMYVFLIPCMYFLFSTILYFKGKRRPYLSTAALLIYIIHPMVIVAVRLFAKILKLEGLLIDNSLVHFLAVSAASAVVGAGLTVLIYKYMPKQSALKHSARIELNTENLLSNVKQINEAMQPGCELMAVVKANAYGHGLFEISSNLNKAGVNAFAVATAEEGIALRSYGISGEILILGSTGCESARQLKKYNLTQTLISAESAKRLNEQGVMFKAHIKIDSGMHRLGAPYNEPQAVREIFEMENINVCGIFTHLSRADSLLPADIMFTKNQIVSFYTLLNTLKKSGILLPKIHVQSTYGLLNYPQFKCNYVRAGLAVYGIYSKPNPEVLNPISLRPVLSLKADIILIRQIKQGEAVGYGTDFIARKNITVAILPIGYADGYPRELSCQKGKVLINGKFAPIIGTICMDRLTVDITGIENVQVGDTAVLIGKQGENELKAEEVAMAASTISNELLCRLGPRLEVYCQ